MTVEDYLYAFLVDEVHTDKKSGNIKLTQVGLTNKVLKMVVMLDINKNISPEITMTLGADNDEPSLINLGNMLLLW